MREHFAAQLVIFRHSWYCLGGGHFLSSEIRSIRFQIGVEPFPQVGIILSVDFSFRFKVIEMDIPHASDKNPSS